MRMSHFICLFVFSRAAYLDFSQLLVGMEETTFCILQVSQ